MMDSPATPAETSGIRFMLAITSGETPKLATMLVTVGSSRSSRFSAAVSTPSSSAAPTVTASRICCSGARRAIARWIWESCVEEPFALVQRVDQPAVLQRVQALGLDHVQGLQAQFQDPGHAAEQADILGGEADADPAEDEQAAGVAADLGVRDGVRAGRQVEGERRPAPTSASSYVGTCSAGMPTAATTVPSIISTAMSASRARAAHSTAACCAAGPSGRSATTERNSVICSVAGATFQKVGRDGVDLSGSRPSGPSRWSYRSHTTGHGSGTVGDHSGMTFVLLRACLGGYRTVQVGPETGKDPPNSPSL